MQLWPAKEKLFAASVAAVSSGASAQTITGVALPSSSATCLRGARSDRGDRVRRHRALRLDPRGLHRLAGLVRNEPRDLVVAPAEPACDLDEDLRALVRGQGLAHRALGRIDGALRLRGARLRHPG